MLRLVPSAVAPPLPIDWEGDPQPSLREAGAWFGDLVGDGPWRVAWCAGAGVVGSSEAELAGETRAVAGFLEALAGWVTPERGAFFLASSAGGVHAGSRDDPVTERSAPAPMSPYGQAKLEQERLVTEWAAATGAAAAIGRLSNLYGPGQNLNKPQGLVSRLVWASLRDEPVLIYVSLDTIRDQLFAADAARRIGALLDRLVATPARGGHVVVKLLASGRSTTIGELIAELHRVRKRRPPVVFGVTATTRLQPSVLRFRSTVWPEIDRGPSATLAEGIAAVTRDQLRVLSQGPRSVEQT